MIYQISTTRCYDVSSSQQTADPQYDFASTGLYVSSLLSTRYPKSLAKPGGKTDRIRTRHDRYARTHSLNTVGSDMKFLGSFRKSLPACHQSLPRRIWLSRQEKPLLRKFRRPTQGGNTTFDYGAR